MIFVLNMFMRQAHHIARFVIILLIAAPYLAQAQDIYQFDFSAKNLVETKWEYTYTLHKESNTIIHQSDESYEYFLYFRYDSIFQQYLNGNLSEGSWQVDGRILKYDFRFVDEFLVRECNDDVLVLEFQQPNSKGHYQYHFVQVSTSNSPFPKPFYELPEVLVETKANRSRARNSKKSWWSRLFPSKGKVVDTPVYVAESSPDYISIELIGGGYYGGINPVLRDYILIKPNGRLVKEFKSVEGGLQVTKKDISRDELKAFVAFVEEQGFFEMERIYDCDQKACQRRKGEKPTPVPLRLSIAHGSKKKVITLSIWGLDEHKTNYIDYPAGLDKIIFAIQDMANRGSSS